MSRLNLDDHLLVGRLSHRLPAFFIFLIFGALTTAIAAPPIIRHEPIPSYPPGQAIPVVVKVDTVGQPIQNVTLAANTSIDSPPIRIQMNDTGGGVYYGEIPANMNVATDQIRYYVTARTGSDFSETPWQTITIGTPAAVESASAPPPVAPVASSPGPVYEPQPAPVEPVAEQNNKKKWKWVAGIAGVAVAVAAVIALSDDDDNGGSNDSTGDSSDGGDGGGTPTPPDMTPSTGGGGGGSTNEPAQTVITQAANDSVRTAIPNFPAQTPIDATSRFDGKTLVSAQINLDYDPVDGFADRFQVLYDNSLVFDSGAVTTAGNATVTVPGGSGMIVISIPSSLRDTTGVFNYSWAASVVYVLE